MESQKAVSGILVVGFFTLKGGVLMVSSPIFLSILYGYHEVRRWLEEAGFVDIALEELPPPMTSPLVSGRRSA